MTEQKIFFITDSACDIPPQEEAQLDNLCILPSRSPQTEKAITRGRALPQKNFMT